MRRIFVLLLAIISVPQAVLPQSEPPSPTATPAAELAQDFETGLHVWRADAFGRIEKSPLGNSWYSLAGTLGQIPALSSPLLPSGANRRLQLRFRYRSSVESSGPDKGSWVLVQFLNEQNSAVGRENVVCATAVEWTTIDRTLAIPEHTAAVRVDFRLQNAVGKFDFDDVRITAAPAETVQDPAAKGWKLVDTFTLDPASGTLRSGSETIEPAGGLTPGYVLPDRDVGSPDLAYDLEISVKPGWSAGTVFNTLFAVGDNMENFQPDSCVLTVLNGTALLSRLNSAVADVAEVNRTNLNGSPEIPLHARVWFSGRKLQLFHQGETAGSADLGTAPFSWPKGRPFYLGGNGSRQRLHGAVLGFTLRVYAPLLKAEFAGGVNGGYFEGGGPHHWSIEFPAGDGERIKDTAEIHDAAGKLVGNLQPRGVTATRHAFDLPALPFGWYSFTAHLTSADGTLEKERAFTITRPVERIDAAASPFGDTTEFALRPDQFDPGLVQNVFARCAAAGVRWFRLWLRWDDIETAKGVYDWGSLDQVVILAQNNGLTLYVCITGGEKPFQAGEGNVGHSGALGLMTPACFMPADLDAWRTFLGQMATRYKGRLAHYQIWNEPDAKNGFYPADPKAYATVLRASAVALRAADPGVKIGLGGFVNLLGEGLRKDSYGPGENAWGELAFYAQDAGAFYDIVDAHLYSMNEPGQSWDRNLPKVRETKSFLASHGDGNKPFWNSETDMYSGPAGQRGGWANVPFLSEEEQASALVQWEVQSLAAGVERSFWYGFRGYTGFVNSDFSPKPAYPALVNAVRLLQGVRYLGEETKTANLRIYRFQRGTEEMTALWTTGTATPVALAGVAAGDIRQADFMGNETTPRDTLLNVTTHPVFLLTKAHLEIEPLAVLDFPVQTSGKPAAGTITLRNPSTRPTRFTVVASLTGGTASTRQVEIGPGVVQAVPLSLAGTGKAVQVELRADGGIQHDFELTQVLEFRETAVLQGAHPMEITLDRADQIVVGGSAYDSQGRPVSAARWTGPADLSAHVKLWRDGGRLRFEATVRDDAVLPAPASRDLYNGDALEYLIEAGGHLYQAIVSADGRTFFHGNEPPPGFNIHAAKTPDGYQQSGSFDLPAGDSLGFDVGIDDADDTSGRKVQMMWSKNPPDFEHPMLGIFMVRP